MGEKRTPQPLTKAACPWCHSEYINPEALSRYGENWMASEMEYLSSGSALNRVCLNCGGEFRILMLPEFVSIPGLEPSGNRNVYPWDHNGDSMYPDAPTRRRIKNRITKAVEKMVENLWRSSYYTIEQIAEITRTGKESVRRCLKRRNLLPTKRSRRS